MHAEAENLVFKDLNQPQKKTEQKSPAEYESAPIVRVKKTAEPEAVFHEEGEGDVAGPGRMTKPDLKAHSAIIERVLLKSCMKQVKKIWQGTRDANIRQRPIKNVPKLFKNVFCSVFKKRIPVLIKTLGSVSLFLILEFGFMPDVNRPIFQK